MTSWAYRATPSGTSYEQTVELLAQHGFLCRTLFKETTQQSSAGRPPLQSHVGDIDPATDELFIYFSDGGELEHIGSFGFAPHRPLAHPDGLAPAIVQVPGCHPLEAALQQAEYSPDTFLGVFTGFDLVALEDGTPPGLPNFTPRTALATFGAANAQPPTSVTRPMPGTPPAPATPPTNSGRCFGVDWSGARLAGNKVWVAELDPRERIVRSVGRPWQSRTAQQTVNGVEEWLGTLTDAWVALDFPFGIATCDRAVLIPGQPDDPRAWGSALAGSFPSVDAFTGDVRGRSLIGVHRRAADRWAPFGPLLWQLIYQTYWGMRLLGQLPSSVALLPWHHASAATTRVLETCPAVLLRALGQSNAGYKLRRGAEAVRAALLDRVLAHAAIQWTCPDDVRQQVIADREGDALDAILAGLAAWRASAVDHAALASRPHLLEEGHIYA